uniref:SH2 domain-containing protein n=1 Tax=Glossina pallidipes TaxID=7398 RepID=A0A1B0AA64_GLOPL
MEYREKFHIQMADSSAGVVFPDSDNTENEIPYHAREQANPFTYGILPKDFQRSDLNHIGIDDVDRSSSKACARNEFSHFDAYDAVKPFSSQTVLPSSPSTVRRTIRSSISASPPLLRKTPSRQEFKEMLEERRHQALKEQNKAIQEAQNAAIQNDLDELQKKLNKNVLQEMEENKMQEHTVTSKSEQLQSESPKRSDTPAFPFHHKSLSDNRCDSPYPPAISQNSSTTDSAEISPTKESNIPIKYVEETRGNCMKSIERAYVVEPHLVKFAKDFSEYWYKSHMPREEAVILLQHAPPGTFIVRNSTTYKNAFGLVLRVAQPPQGITGTSADTLVRHFLIEPTARGVRLRGCSNEPTFTSLSALVYQHSINQLSLPNRLIIPHRDLTTSAEDDELLQTQRELWQQGAFCNVLYLLSVNMESLTGDEAIRKAVNELHTFNPPPLPLEVQFKVSGNGITLTDNTRRVFFRRHYKPSNISYIALDPDKQSYTVFVLDEKTERAINKTLFAFVARETAGAHDNQCHVFCDLEMNQPASAIVSFANKVLRKGENALNIL